MKTYLGACHCGQIKFRFDGPEIINGLRCNCSMCRRKGAVMTTYTVPARKLDIDAVEGALGSYTFASHLAEHYFCRRCGIYTFHQSKAKPGQLRINIGCVDDIDSINLPFAVYDGASVTED